MKKRKIRFFKVMTPDGSVIVAGDCTEHESDQSKCYLCAPDGRRILEANRKKVFEVHKEDSAKLLRGYLLEQSKKN